MKKIVPLLLATTYFFCGCGSSGETTTEVSTSEIGTFFEEKTSTYKNDFIEFEYNSNMITNANLTVENTDFYVLSKLIDDTIPTNVSSVSDVQGVAILGFNPNEIDSNLYTTYQLDYKNALVYFLNGLFGEDYLTEDDITGKPTTTIECDKILPSGNHIKAKFLYIDNNNCVIVVCNLLPNIKEEEATELINVYNSIIYNPRATVEISTETTTKATISSNNNSNPLSAKTYKDVPWLADFGEFMGIKSTKTTSSKGSIFYFYNFNDIDTDKFIRYLDILTLSDYKNYKGNEDSSDLSKIELTYTKTDENFLYIVQIHMDTLKNLTVIAATKTQL